MKHITKISTLIIALTLAMSASAASGIDWTSLPWLGNGSGLPAHTNKYKVSPVVGMQVVNVQIPGFSSGAVGIYLTIGTQIDNCSVANNIQGGGILLHLSAFTAKETEVTINYHSGIESHKCTFWVYYADGSGDAGGSDVDEPETPVESTYCHELLISGNCTIYLTNEKLSENNYRLTIEGENLVDVHNTYYNPAATKLVPTSVTSEKIICDFTATSTPKFYTPLYIKTTTSDEVTFANIHNKDLIWGTCSATPEPIYNSISESVCFGETYTWNGQTYSTTGEYTQEFTAVNGADSIVTLTLTVYPQTSNTTEDATIDFGETYTWHNQEYTATGTYTITLQDANGCDYQATLNLTVNSNSPSTPSTCTYEGGPGDALMEQPGQDQFESGYRITLTLDEADPDKIHITATVFDDDAPASVAYFQNYPNYNYSEDTNEHRFAGSDRNTFETTISISSLISNRADGIIRFAIKFAYPNGVIKVTTPEFFYLDGSGCAQRVFAIYHHDDVPATPFEGEDQFTEFRGGRILQQIQYKRILRPDTWETFCVPFEVDSVTVYDPDDQQNYHLHAQYNNGGTTVAGHFWLREFTTREVILDAFQPNWHDITATSQVEALPKKDVPYIIRVPAGDYYTDKYVVFHGKGYQTIASEYDIPTAPADNYFSYSGNNTMMPQTLTSAYVLESAGYYFLANSSGVTLHPFECSVNASATTIARMPRISLNDRERTVTDVQDLPTTDLSDGVIYTVYGAAVVEFHSLEQYDEARAQLPAGVYLVTTPTSVIKICVQ